MITSWYKNEKLRIIKKIISSNSRFCGVLNRLTKYLLFKLSVYFTCIIFPLLYFNMYFWYWYITELAVYYESKRMRGSDLTYENNRTVCAVARARARITRGIRAVYARTYNFDRYVDGNCLHSRCHWNQLSIESSRCIISASCTYEFPISVADTYTLFLLRPLHNTYTLCSCASYSMERRQEPPVYTISPAVAHLTFLLAISTCHSCQTWLSRQDNEHHSLRRVPRPFPLLPRFSAPFPRPFVLRDPSPSLGHKVEWEQIRYPLTSTGEFEVLIAVNPTAVCSRARLTRVLSEQQGVRRVTAKCFPLVKQDC